MILYALRCDNGHSFEAWFRDGATYDRQVEAGAIMCPICDSRSVSKAIMAPRLARHHGARQDDGNATATGHNPDSATPDRATPDAPDGATPGQPGALTAPPSPGAARLVAALEHLRDEITKKCDDVGDTFAEEARRIHYGETPARGIYGRTTPDEADALRDEGIAFATIPWPRRTDG